MKITKLITRSSIALLALCSTSAFAGIWGVGPVVDLVPDYTLHKATVNFKVTYGLAGKIEKETLKNKDMIDLLGGDADVDGQVLALAIPCDVNDSLIDFPGVPGHIINPDVIALMVIDKNYEIRVPLTEVLILDLTSGALELKNADPKKLDLVAQIFGDPLDDGFTLDTLSTSGTIKFGKLGSKIADMGVLWDKDEICPKTMSGKSTTGTIGSVVDPIADINLMSGKISGGGAKVGVDCDPLAILDPDLGGLCSI
jgi:hypothetical protein